MTSRLPVEGIGAEAVGSHVPAEGATSGRPGTKEFEPTRTLPGRSRDPGGPSKER
ncbi:MAG: hypothetical protein ACLFVZ_04700 [Actinomycetota bacterium]